MPRLRNILSLASILVVTMSCVRAPSTPSEPLKHRTYKVERLAKPMNIDGKWNKRQWRRIETVEIENCLGKEPTHRPKAQAKVLYDDTHIYVIFRVEDRYVRAVAQEYHGQVWKDSCVEFFFTPGTDVSQGYFNLEVNCGGTALLHFQKIPRKDPKSIDVADMQRIEIAHSMPRIVEPEITEPTTWTIEYRIPIAVLEKHSRVARPGPGVVWRANFYKCADDTSHPHWLTWSLIDGPRLDFHLPQFFGTLEFM